METIESDGVDILLLGGSSDRGTLYAVYSLLEDVLGVGFFRDGEYLPRLDDIELGDLDISERPRFSDREDGSGCIFAYSTPFWDWEDWRRELDWRAKRRANVIWPFNIGGDIVAHIMSDWGVSPRPPEKPLEKTLHERCYEYARDLGMRIPVIIPNGSLPDAFFEAHPECRTILSKYSDYAPYRQLHPSDPYFKRLVVEFIRRYANRYGTDHLYIAEFVSESVILDGADDVQHTRLDFARAMSEAILEADPEGTWMPCSWSWDMFHDPPEGWTPQQISEYLDAIDMPLVVWDLWSEEAAKYEKTEYFFGRPWGFGVLHSFGGNTYLHGDVPGLIDRVHRLVEDPRGRECNLFLSAPEIIDYNEFYIELASKLSWDPAKITLEGYIVDYCTHRYGQELGGILEPAWWDLVETVYGPDSGGIVILMDPLYWLRPNLELLHGSPKVTPIAGRLWPGREAYIPRLQSAIKTFLENSDQVRENQMATRDLLDITRQWIAERFNLQIRRTRDAFLVGDEIEFENGARECLQLLDDQTRLLSSWPPYRLDKKIERARDIHGNDADRAVKHFQVWVSYGDGPETEAESLRDYYRMDLDGLVSDLYRPRMEAFIAHLRDKLAEGEKTLDNDELDSIYTRIERRFISSYHKTYPIEDAISVICDLLEGEAPS
jgi:alpha-N-acetylglucosaminidase